MRCSACIAKALRDMPLDQGRGHTRPKADVRIVSGRGPADRAGSRREIDAQTSIPTGVLSKGSAPCAPSASGEANHDSVLKLNGVRPWRALDSWRGKALSTEIGVGDASVRNHNLSSYQGRAVCHIDQPRSEAFRRTSWTSRPRKIAISSMRPANARALSRSNRSFSDHGSPSYSGR